MWLLITEKLKMKCPLWMSVTFEKLSKYKIILSSMEQIFSSVDKLAMNYGIKKL